MASAEETVTLRLQSVNEADAGLKQVKQHVDNLKKSYEDAAEKANKLAAANNKQWVDASREAGKHFDTLQKSYGELNRAIEKSRHAHEGYDQALSKLKSQASAFSGELDNMIGRYASTAAVIETVRKGFMGFAEDTRAFNRIKADTSASTQQVHELEKSITKLSSTTGASMGELQKGFRSFQQESGLGIDQARKTYEQVSQAAHAAGVSTQALAKATVAAMAQMSVPVTEVQGVLDTWVKTVPSGMMGAWAEAAPRILGTLKSIGFTGKEVAGQVGASFAEMGKQLGSAGAGGAALDQIWSKARDFGTYLGKITIPALERLRDDPDAYNKGLKAIHAELESLGAFDTSDLAHQSVMANRVGLTPQVLQAFDQHIAKLKEMEEIAAKYGVTVDEVAKRTKELAEDPQAAIDRLTASFTAATTAVGGTVDAMGGSKALQALGMALDIWTKLQSVSSLFSMGVPAITPAQIGAAGVKAGVQWWKGGGEHGEGEHAPEPMSAEKQNAVDEEIRKRRLLKPPSSRRAFATGGQFTVPGSGASDTEPVDFMATPGERVTVEPKAAATQESLQRQQDKADIALREHFARFHDKPDKAGSDLISSLLKPADRSGGPGSGFDKSGRFRGDPAADPRTGTGPGGGGRDTTTSPPVTAGPATPPTSGPGYNIGPYGQPMPAWGTHVTEGEDYGGGTGGGVAGGVPGLPGGPSGRALTKEERAAGGVVAGSGVGSGGNTSLAAQRERFREEMKNNPALREKVLAIAAGEHKNNDANTSVIESAMNRASMMGTSLAYEMRLTKEGGYYAGYDPGALNNPGYRKTAEANLERALGGSNVSDYATENASGAWGRARMNGGMFTKVSEHGGTHPELFGIPTGPGARGYNKYKAWKEKSQAGQQAPQQAGPAGTGAGAPAGAGTVGTTGYDADVQFMRERGGHDKRSDPQDTGAIHPELARRLAQAGRDFERDNPGQKANYGEMYRDIATQTKYYNEYKATGKGLAAPPGPNAPHQGRATDIKRGAFRDYVERNAGKYGVEFLTGDAYRRDPVHVQLSAREWAELKKKPDSAYKVAGPATAAPAVPATPAVPPYKVGQTQGLPGTPSGPAIKRPKGPDAPAPLPPVPIRRIPSAPGQEDRAAGKGSIVRPISAVGKEERAAGKGVSAREPVARKIHPAGEEDAAAGKNIGPEPPEGRQYGGNVYEGREYTVGEGGKEETFVPDQPGRIRPGGQPGSGQTSTDFERMRRDLERPIEPVIKPRMQQMGPPSLRWSKHTARQQQADAGRMAARASHTDGGFA